MRTKLKKNDEYYTPLDILKIFGKFDYDPCTTNIIARYHKMKYWDTKETNGLKRNWREFKKIWINPPFTNKREFIKKAKEEYESNNKIKIFILIPIEYLITKEFSELKLKYTIYIPNKRIRFLGSEKTPSFGCVIIKLSKRNKLINIKIN